MPQMNKGGKFIFGQSLIRPDGRVRFPPQAAEEYRIASEGKVYLFTGSKITGGFCVTRQGTASAVEACAYSDRNAGASDTTKRPTGNFTPIQGALVLPDRRFGVR